MECNKSYVYVLIDPRTYQIFYVGKGVGNRISSHVKEARTTSKNSKKLNKIRKIESLGLEVIAKKVEENISDSDAIDLEKLIISECRLHGIDLCNLTLGGEGSSGYIHSEESKRKISAAGKGVPKPESQKEKLRELLLSGNHPVFSEESRSKNKGENHWAYGLTGKDHPSYGRKDSLEMIEAKRQRMLGTKRGTCSEEVKEKIRKATTGVKKSNTENMKGTRRKVICPYCNKEGGANTMHRWHFDNCKHKENADVGE